MSIPNNTLYPHPHAILKPAAKQNTRKRKSGSLQSTSAAVVNGESAKRHQQNGSASNHVDTLAKAALQASSSTAASSSSSVTIKSSFGSLMSFYKQVRMHQQTILPTETRQIYEQIQANRNIWHEQALKLNESYYVHSSKSLPRSVFCSVDNRIYILFNKATDLLIGKGAAKNVKLALCFDTGVWMANSSIHNVEGYAQTELDNFIQLKGTPGMCQMQQYVRYVNKNNEPKIRILTPWEPKTLFNFLVTISQKPDDFPMKMRMNVLRQVFNIVVTLHKKNILIRDLKPSNILMSTDHRVSLTDFGMLCSENDKRAREVAGTTSWFAPPEYADASLQEHLKEKDVNGKPATAADFSDINTKALDIWSLGGIVHSLMYHSQPNWFQSLIEEHAHVDLLNAVSGAVESVLPKPWHEDSVQHLLWRMFMIDPAKRLTSEELETALKKPLLLIREQNDSYLVIYVLERKLNEFIRKRDCMIQNKSSDYEESIEVLKLVITKIYQRITEVRKYPDRSVLNKKNKYYDKNTLTRIYEMALGQELFEKAKQIPTIEAD